MTYTRCLQHPWIHLENHEGSETFNAMHGGDLTQHYVMVALCPLCVDRHFELIEELTLTRTLAKHYQQFIHKSGANWTAQQWQELQAIIEPILQAIQNVGV